jgi:hypothetical protein
MGKKWTEKTKILFEKKKELNLNKLTIAYMKQYTNNPYQLVYEGKHVAFFPTWESAFDSIDKVYECGVEIVRNDNKRIKKEEIISDNKMLCYRCNQFYEFNFFKGGHKYCVNCELKHKKEHYYLNKYKLNENKYSTFERYLSSLLCKRHRNKYFNIDDLMLILKKQNYRCAITGQEFELKKGSPKLPSIDRIIPKKNGGEYNLDNIQIIWHSINMFKSVYDLEFLIECSEYIICNKKIV